MPVLGFFNFKKMRNAVSPKLIAEPQAQLAIETDTRQGTLQSYDGLVKEADLSKNGTIRTIFPITDDLWLHWTERVSIARAPIANNEYHRIVFTGTDVSRFTDENLAVQGGGTNYPEVSYTLGLPQPDKILECSVAMQPATGLLQLSWDIAGTTDDQNGGRQARMYTYTFVNENGDEGPPADPSNICFANDDDVVTLTNFAGVPTGAYNIAKVRIYRTVAANTTQYSWLLVDELDMPVTSYDDTKTAASLNVMLTSTLYSPPPTDLQGVVALANGMLAGYVGNAVYFSEPYQSHAWPEDYVRYVDHDIIGLSSSGNMLYVLTKGWPYLAVGNHPTVISLNKLEKAPACVSAQSIVDIGNGVLYAAENALVAIVGQTVKAISDGIIDWKFWRSLNPSSILGVYHNGCYFGFYSATEAPDPQLPLEGGFVFDPTAQELMFLNLYTTAAYADAVTGKLYVVQQVNNANEIWVWDQDDTGKRPYIWRSKITESNLRNLEAGRVSARDWPVLVRVYADGTEVFSKSVTGPEPFRLPTGYQARNIEVQVEASVEVDSVLLADYVGELQ